MFTVLVVGDFAPRLVVDLGRARIDIIVGTLSWSTVREVDPDLIVLAGYSERVPDAMLTSYETIGFHPSLLPRYRGGSAIKWQLHHDERDLGASVYRLMPGKMDAGPLIDQERLGATHPLTAGLLYAHTVDAGLRALTRAVKAYAVGDWTETPQDEALATWQPRLARGQSPQEFLDARQEATPA